MERAMAFEEIKYHGGRGFRLAPDQVKIGASFAGNRASPYITLGRDVCTSLGLERGSRVSIAKGTDNDHGWLRLAKAQNGFTVFKHGAPNRALRLSLSVIADGQKHGSEACEHRIEDGALYIRLPDWCNGAA
jgi:hypothetical protein